MNKSEGQWRCRACGREWHGSQLYDDPNSTAAICCADLGCGGVCDRVYKIVAEEQGATATFYTTEPNILYSRCRDVGYISIYVFEHED